MNNRSDFRSQQAAVENLVGSQQARQIMGALQKLDPQTMAKLQAMAQKVDQQELTRALEANRNEIQRSLQQGDFMQRLRQLIGDS
ncbi:MAG: hypothetical protein ACOX7F_08915 [Eubacteriales bacterium]|jgi:predicted transcriptional regulator